MRFGLFSLSDLVALAAVVSAAPSAPAQGSAQGTTPSPPACDEERRVALEAADAWSGEFGSGMTVCLDVDLEADEFVRAKATVETSSPMAGVLIEVWGPETKGGRERETLLRPTVGAGSPPVPTTSSSEGGGRHTLVLDGYWSWQPLEEPVMAHAWIDAIEPPELVEARRRALKSDARLAWLRDHAVPVRSVSPGEEDFEDLEFLREVLDGVRVVLLGESTRGSGTDLLAKTRLVKFLHRELGEESYTLAMTSYRGTFALPNGSSPQRILPDQDARFEFEELMAAAGFEYAFVDLQNPASRKSWIGGWFLARPDGYRSRDRAWSEVLDGLLFIRDQRRSQRADSR